MKVLVTGFTPFGGETINPAWEAVKALPDRVGSIDIVKTELPTVYRTAGELLWKVVRQERPDAVLCTGQAGGRAGISVERVAVNLADFPIPDNEGNQPIDQPIWFGGKNAYFSTLPVKQIVQKIRDSGIPASLSYSAGTFVCNDVMYWLLHLAECENPRLRGGFIHVPYSHEQAVPKPAGTPSMSISDMTEAIRLSIEALEQTNVNSDGRMGMLS